MDTLVQFANFISKFVKIVNKEQSKILKVKPEKRKPLSLDAFKLNIIKEMDKYKGKPFRWTQKKKNFLVIFLNFIFFWVLIIELLEHKIENTEIYDKFFFELIDVSYLSYFGIFFQNEIEQYKITFLLNQIVYVNRYYKNFYNYLSLYNNNNLDMLKHFNFSKILLENKIKIDGKILEIIKESSIVYSKYKRYFRNETEQDINLDEFEHKVEEYIENDSFLKYWSEDSDELPSNINELSDKYGLDDEEQFGQNLNETSEEVLLEHNWNALYGPKGYHDFRFIYSTLNRLRREEKTFFTDPFFYSIILDKFQINFYIFDEIVLRGLEIFLSNWQNFYFDNLYFNIKWEQVNDLIFSKSIFQLKIDLETFLSLTKYLAWFRNHTYDKYIYTHNKLFDKLKFRLLYINNIRVWFKRRPWRLNLEYIKQLQSKNYFIIRFKKEYSNEFYVIYEEDICYNLYSNSFLKHSIILNNTFITGLTLITKKFDFYNFNLMLYQVLCENPNIYCIEELFIYHYENVNKYLFFFSSEKHLMWITLIDLNENLFLCNLLNQEYIFKYFFAIDLNIFCKPMSMGLHYILQYESKIFLKFLKMGVIRFILRKLRFKIYAKEESLARNFIDLEFWSKWYLKGFKYIKSSILKIKQIEIEPIDYFVFWITRLYRDYHVFNSFYDFIYYSRYISNYIFCKYLFEGDLFKKWTYKNSPLLEETDLLLNEEHDTGVLKLNEYWVIMYYRDLLLSLINSSILLHIVFFYIFEQKYKINTMYGFNRYFLIRNYGWNDVKKIKI